MITRAITSLSLLAISVALPRFDAFAGVRINVDINTQRMSIPMGDYAIAGQFQQVDVAMLRQPVNSGQRVWNVNGIHASIIGRPCRTQSSLLAVSQLTALMTHANLAALRRVGACVWLLAMPAACFVLSGVTGPVAQELW